MRLRTRYLVIPQALVLVAAIVAVSRQTTVVGAVSQGPMAPTVAAIRTASPAAQVGLQAAAQGPP